MACSGLVLLLIGVISSHLPEIQARPADFWCNSQARKNMGNKIEGLKKEMADCVGSDMLSSPVQLPCVWMHTAKWANETLQQKHAEVVETLQMFRDGVQRAWNETRLQCQTPLLKELGRHITNYLAIVNRLQIQDDQVIPSYPTVQICSSQTNLNKVLEQFKMLLKGKLERFAVDLRDIICRAEHRTTAQ